MKRYKNYYDNRKRILKFIKANPSATDRIIRKEIKVHPDNYFKGGMAEIFNEAKVKPPRNFKRKTREENKKIIIEFIRKNPRVGGHTIRKETKINFTNFFKDIKDAYKEAGIKYKRRNNKFPEKYKNGIRKKVIRLVKKNPHVTYQEIESKFNINLKCFFNGLDEIYENAGIKRIGQGEKIRNKKRGEVINFIRKNPTATQREINKNCKTKVQNIFKRGIFEAYEKAGIEYPFERLKLYGTALKDIKKRARDFEEKISVVLSGYGKVNRLVKTKRGVADLIFERKENNYRS